MSNAPLANPKVRTPSRSPGPVVNTALPPMPADEPTPTPTPATATATATAETPRRSSFSFLRRGKSIERLNSKRSVSGSKKLTKKQLKEQDLNAQKEAVPMQAPKIPDLAHPPSLQTFGGESARPDSYAIVANKAGSTPYSSGRYTPQQERRVGSHGVPIPPMPGQSGYVDPYARTESMTNRGRFSYASSAVSSVNNPRRVRRRKDPTPYNILVVGARNSGKSSFVDFLRTSLTLPARKQRPARDDFAQESGPSKFNSAFVAQYLETELDDGERIGLTLWDSEGLDQNIIDLQLRQTTSFIESKFEDTFTEETKIMRSPGARDTHIHCAFLVLDPLRLDQTMRANANHTAGLSSSGNINGKSFIQPPSPNTASTTFRSDDLDLQVLRALSGKTTVIPVISKADTITIDHMEFLKRTVWDNVKSSGLDHLSALGLDDNEDVFESSDDDSDYDAASSPPPPHGRHNSKKFDERDEDQMLHPDSAAYDPEDRSVHSRLDLSSSSSASSAKTSTPKEKAPASSTPYLPLSILSPSPIIPHEPGVGKVGRRFPWGFADPYNPGHCDFVKLKDSVFGDWRSELREASRDVWYEQWRTTRLNRSASLSPGRGKSTSVSPGRATPSGRENAPPASMGGARGRQAEIPVGMRGTSGGFDTGVGQGPVQASQGASWPLPAR